MNRKDVFNKARVN